MTQETSNAEVAQNQAPSNLSVNDLTIMLKVIQTAASRGAFQAEEMTTVGGVYDRIAQFLESVGAITVNRSETTDTQGA